MNRLRNHQRPAPAPASADARRPCVAYVMTTFPALSEAFTLNEMAVVEEQGLEIVPISLSHPRDPVTHPDARLFMGRSIYLSYNPLGLSFETLCALFLSPGRYMHA